MKQQYPTLRQKAARPTLEEQHKGRGKASVYFIETAPTHRPVSKETGKSPREGAADRSPSVLWAVPPRGPALFRILAGPPDAEACIDFLRQLLVDSPGSVYAIDDTGVATGSVAVLRFVLAEERMRVFVVSRYPRELGETDLRVLALPARSPTCSSADRTAEPSRDKEGDQNV